MPEKEHFHECSVKGKLTELLKVTISVFSKPVTNHPRKLCLLSTQAVPSPPKKDVALRCSPWTLKQMWGCWNVMWGFQGESVSTEHFVLSLPEPNSSMPWCNLVTCSCHLQSKTSGALHRGPPHFLQSFPALGFRAPWLWLSGFGVQHCSPWPWLCWAVWDTVGMSLQPGCPVGFPGVD